MGLLYTFNILTANYALLYISFLNQTIGRNCRYLMVVLVGAFFSRVKKGSALKLEPKKVITALVITVGVLLFTILKVHLSIDRLGIRPKPTSIRTNSGRGFSCWQYQ